ncbi:MAG: hypothetical protein ACOY31_00080 [Bacillota bacterium]
MNGFISDQTGIILDELALSIPVEDIPLKEVAVEDLPLHIVISSRVYTVGLPVNEFSGTEEFDEYIERYAREKYSDTAKINRFIKRQKINALVIEDEIKGDRVWQYDGKVRFKNARLCSFGILKAQPGQYFMFDAGFQADPAYHLAAYQALTYKSISRYHLPLFAGPESRENTKSAIGNQLYNMVMKALTG